MREEVRVCATAIVYEVDPEHVGLTRLFGSTDAAGTTNYVIGVDQKSVPGTADWLRGRLPSADVFEFDWSDDFAAARNLTVARVPADCEWWYWIDADDVLEARQGAQMPDLLASLPLDVGVVGILYRFENGGATERGVFFRRSIGARWQGAVHENVEIPTQCCSVEFARRHERDDKSRWTPRRGRNMRILRRMVEHEPQRSLLWFYLAVEHTILNEWHEAQACFGRALDSEIDHERAYWFAIHGADAARRVGDFSTAASWASRAASAFEDRPEGHLILGTVRHWHDEAELARQSLERGTAILATGYRPPLDFLTPPPSFYFVQPWLILFDLYAASGEYHRASRCADVVLLEPSLAPSLGSYVAQLRDRTQAGEAVPVVPVPSQMVALEKVWGAMAVVRSYPCAEAFALEREDVLAPLELAMDQEAVLAFAEGYFRDEPPPLTELRGVR